MLIISDFTLVIFKFFRFFKKRKGSPILDAKEVREDQVAKNKTALSLYKKAKCMVKEEFKGYSYEDVMYLIGHLKQQIEIQSVVKE